MWGLQVDNKTVKRIWLKPDTNQQGTVVFRVSEEHPCPSATLWDAGLIHHHFFPIFVLLPLGELKFLF